MMVFPELFWPSVLTLPMAKSRLESLEGLTDSPGMATGSGKALGPVPSQVLPQWAEEERLITSLELPGREQRLRKPGNSGEGRRCD